MYSYVERTNEQQGAAPGAVGAGLLTFTYLTDPIFSFLFCSVLFCSVLLPPFLLLIVPGRASGLGQLLFLRKVVSKVLYLTLGTRTLPCRLYLVNGMNE